mmetsp:Transcript_13537/g.14871  ORF Transcript_13537/g.14871 Transcript_13537/m.14871 type:complete len:131 (+) Transcript_13537:817-1209(+)
MLVGDEISELVLPPGDEVSPSGEDEAPSGREGTPSRDEGIRKDATASGIVGSEGIGGSSSEDDDGSSGIGGRDSSPGSEGIGGKEGICGSCNVSVESVVKVGSISSASTCRSRLEVTREAQTSASKTPSE